MKKIKNFKISLMEKYQTSLEENKEENKDVFIIKYSSYLNVKDFLEKTNKYYNDEEYEEFILESASLIYDNLINNKVSNVDNVGLWITFEDDEIIDNSIKISVLDDIKRYGDKDINSLKEFVKMTLNK